MSTAPNWTERPEWSQEEPTAEWGKKCAEKWCLLAPFDTRITEEQWKVYYEERSALDLVNTLRGGETTQVESDDLAQDTWEILRRAVGGVAAAILGSKLDDGERKKKIAHTLLGSLYFMSLAGVDEGDNEPNPRHLDSETRLYSPFGIGTSIDFHYNYHFRERYSSSNERAASLDAVARSIEHCDAQKPLKCIAAEAGSDDGEPIVTVAGGTIFDRVEGRSQIIPAANIRAFEEPLFGCKGWLSPLKLADLILAAGAVMCCSEKDTQTPMSFAKKLRYFPGENNGKTEAAEEMAQLEILEEEDEKLAAETDEYWEDRELCMPRQFLMLALRDRGAGGPAASTTN